MSDMYCVPTAKNGNKRSFSDFILTATVVFVFEDMLVNIPDSFANPDVNALGLIAIRSL